MKTTIERLLEWAINKINKDYKDDVCLLIGGSRLKLEKDCDGEGFDCFDFYIPANENANSLAKTFIVDGIGYDLYPRTWDRIEKMANLDDYNTTLMEYQILYYRTEEDKQRFLSLRNKLYENLQNPEFMFKKALERLNVAMEIYQTMMFEEKLGEVRMAAGFIADYLSVSVAFTNQTFFKKSQIEQIEELSALPLVPENFIEYYQEIINANTIEELKKWSHLMISSTRKFLSARKAKSSNNVSADFQNLADWYQELCYTWRRIYHACDTNDAPRAFIWGCMLQQELNVVKEEFSLDKMDLLDVYNAKDLIPFHKNAEKLEKYILEKLQDHHIKINSYATVEEFIENNL